METNKRPRVNKLGSVKNSEQNELELITNLFNNYNKFKEENIINKTLKTLQIKQIEINQFKEDTIFIDTYLNIIEMLRTIMYQIITINN